MDFVSSDPGSSLALIPTVTLDGSGGTQGPGSTGGDTTSTNWLDLAQGLSNLGLTWYRVLNQPTPPTGSPTATVTTTPGSTSVSLSGILVLALIVGVIAVVFLLAK